MSKFKQEILCLILNFGNPNHEDMVEVIINLIQSKFNKSVVLESLDSTKKIAPHNIELINNKIEKSHIIALVVSDVLTDAFYYKLGLAHAYKKTVLIINLNANPYPFPSYLHYHCIIRLTEDSELFVTEIENFFDIILRNDTKMLIYNSVFSRCNEIEIKRPNLCIKLDKTEFLSYITDEDIQKFKLDTVKCRELLIHKLFRNKNDFYMYIINASRNKDARFKEESIPKGRREHGHRKTRRANRYQHSCRR